MKRFAFYIDSDIIYNNIVQDECANGDFVLFEDVQAEISRLRELLSELVDEVGSSYDTISVRETSAFVAAKAEVDCDE